METVVRGLCAWVTKDERKSFKFILGKEHMYRMGNNDNKDPVRGKSISVVYGKAPNIIRENITFIDICPMNTVWNPFYSSLYAPVYLGQEDDSFLKDDLIPCLTKLYKSVDTSQGHIQRNYPQWSNQSLVLDWHLNRSFWKGRVVRDKGDVEHIKRFRKYDYRFGN